ncbi:hypothetical protein F4859DRAFT_504090 [Xylaria cf. heliscus]|nr:hypothetical protein F4859DRAFT_504090 [Xylaria cf. heliscus]
MSRRSSPCSNDYIDSYTSILFDDSYLKTLKPGIDYHFGEMLSDLRMIENSRKILKERNIQSHEVKRRDLDDVDKRLDWTEKMNEEYASYKAKVDASGKIAKNSGDLDLSVQEKVRNIALEDEKKWLEAAITAASARLGFMTKYPDALCIPSTRRHIKVAEDNLNSAKLAVGRIEVQKKSMPKFLLISDEDALNKTSVAGYTKASYEY